MEKFKKYSSTQLMNKIVSSKSTPEEKLFCEQIIIDRGDVIASQTKKSKFKRPASAIEPKIEEITDEAPEIIVNKKVKSPTPIAEKEEPKEKIITPEVDFFPQGTKVEFKSSPRSKGAGEVLQGFIIRNFFDNQDKSDYYYIKVGTDKYCKKINAVKKV